jgi:hypothetical protein
MKKLIRASWALAADIPAVRKKVHAIAAAILYMGRFPLAWVAVAGE